jgi:hypothetical protein
MRDVQQINQQSRYTAPACKDCGAPPKEGRVRCAGCLAKRTAYHRNLSKQWIEEGRCRTCGSPDRVEDRSACQRCLDSMKRFISKRRAQRKAESLCYECGNRSELGQVRCVTCGQKYREGLPRPISKALNGLRTKRAQAARDAAAKLKREFIDRNIHLIKDERTKTILLARRGTTAKTCQTLAQIGCRLGITRERVRQIQARAELEMMVYSGETDMPLLTTQVSGTGRDRR